MRSTVQRKIIILGLGLSILLMITAFTTSFLIFLYKSKDNYIKTIDNSILELSNSIGDEESIGKAQIIVYSFLEECLSHLHDDVPNFSNKDEQYEYYKKLYPNIYPGNGFDMSQDKIINRNAYLEISSALKNAAISAGSTRAYAGIVIDGAYSGDNGRFIYLFDSDFRFEKDNWTGVPFGTDYHFTENDRDLNPGSLTGEFYINGKNTKVIDFYMGKYKELFGSDSAVNYGLSKDINDLDIYITAFIEYDLSTINNDLLLFGIVNGISLLLISILFMIAYIVIARLVIIRNIVRLTDSTNEFTTNIINGDVNSVIYPKIKAKDEIGILSNSFVKMEDEIINYTKKIEQATTEREKINAELQVATTIQLESLPKNSLNDKNVLIRTSIESAKEVGGDFYDYFYIDNDHLAIIVSDVSGKGIPAALFMMKSKELLKSKLMINSNLEQVCYEVNNELLSNNEAGLFITAFVGILNTKTNVLEIVNAGHEKPFLIRAGEVTRLEVNSNFILGGVDDFKYQKDIIQLSKEDKLFIHTDGLNESINNKREEFGYDRISESLKKSEGLRLDEIIKDITKSLNEFSDGEEAFDDVTMVLLEIKSPKLSFTFTNPDYLIIDIVTSKFNDYYSYINKDVLSKISIIFDEILNNYISYEKIDNLVISIDIDYSDNCFNIIFRNNGNEFNPLLKEKKYIESDSDLTPGGLGITMVREMATGISYERKDNFNVLTVKMKV